MRMLMLTQTFFPSVGGGIRYKSAIVDHFRAQGHTVDVLAISTDSRLKVDPDRNGTIVRAPQLLRIDSTQVAPSYVWLFGQLAPEYDLLHFNFPSPMTELALLRHGARVRRQKKVVTYHADIVSAKRFSSVYNRFVTRPFLQRMDAIIVSSPKIAESSPHLAEHATKTNVIPFGIEPSAFVRKTNGSSVRGASDELSILFVGRLARYKGIDVLLRALTRAPGRLTIVGEGPLRAGLEELVRSLGLSERVVFKGYIDDPELIECYHAADVLVLPSTDAGEAFGYVLLEAMICESALISTELGTGTSYVNKHEETGIVVPPGDAEALGAAIARLAGDRATLTRFKVAARRRVLERFTVQRMLGDTEALYASCRGGEVRDERQRAHE
jgi:O-antigen biosynthesis rhamnosyltransferase